MDTQHATLSKPKLRHISKQYVAHRDQTSHTGCKVQCAYPLPLRISRKYLCRRSHVLSHDLSPWQCHRSSVTCNQAPYTNIGVQNEQTPDHNTDVSPQNSQKCCILTSLTWGGRHYKRVAAGLRQETLGKS